MMIGITERNHESEKIGNKRKYNWKSANFYLIYKDDILAKRKLKMDCHAYNDIIYVCTIILLVKVHKASFGKFH